MAPRAIPTTKYNSRLQPQEFVASSTGGIAIDITYNYTDPVNGGNAGHVFSITNNTNSSRTQNFTYDQVSRITSAGTSATSGTYCWGYQYSYDPWGNLTSQAGWSPNYNGCSQTVLAGITADGNNHISAFSYDAAGNAANDGTYAYTWDAESQLKSAGGVTYSYDGDGRRVAKVGSKVYWYGAGSEILAETDVSGNALNEYVFFGGKRIALLPVGGAAQSYVEDSLGSSRIVTTNSGSVCYDADFYPYGGERTVTDTCTQNNYKFEGKERDTETGNDDFGARYYSWRFGRWLSADWSSVPVAVPYANLTNPQTLNLYAMVADDPESFVDLDGHENENAAGGTPAPQPSCQVNGEYSCNAGPASESAEDKAKRAFSTVMSDYFHSLGASDSLIGAFDAAYNAVASTINPSAAVSDPHAPQIVQLEPLNTEQKIASTTTTVAIVVAPIIIGVAAGETTPRSIPAGPSARPTAAQQAAINEMGEAYGCHTCGAKTPGTKSGNWVGDHQPPTAQNSSGGPQVYKPQCLACSRQQGGLVRAAVAAAAKIAISIIMQ